jgi:hypothetical protein
MSSGDEDVMVVLTDGVFGSRTPGRPRYGRGMEGAGGLDQIAPLACVTEPKGIVH